MLIPVLLGHCVAGMKKCCVWIRLMPAAAGWQQCESLWTCFLQSQSRTRLSEGKGQPSKLLEIWVWLNAASKSLMHIASRNYPCRAQQQKVIPQPAFPKSQLLNLMFHKWTSILIVQRWGLSCHSSKEKEKGELYLENYNQQPNI